MPKIDAARIAELRAKHDRFTLAEAACRGLVPGSVPMDLISAVPTLLDEIERVNAWLAAGHEVIERCSPEALAAKDARIAELERESFEFAKDVQRIDGQRGEQQSRAEAAERRVAKLEKIARDVALNSILASQLPGLAEAARAALDVDA